jgi:outer membrane protein OmpA-like peptidoglycan-associated protein
MKRVLRSRISVAFLALAFVFVCSSAMLAQEETIAPKVDFFAGYSFLNPGGDINGLKVPGINRGADGSATFNLNKFLGVTADFGYHWSDKSDSGNVTTLLFGPKLTFRYGHFAPFVEGLVGVVRLNPNAPGISTQDTLGAGGGGGVDLWFTRHIGVRVVQADYIYQNYSRVINPGGSGRWNSTRVQGGILFGLGGEKPLPPPTSTCSAQPSAVLAGEPITVTISTQNFNPKHTVSYQWQTTGGKVSGKETSASVDTTGLTPGPYTVTGTATDPKVKKNNTTQCTAQFTINEPPKHPPTIACSANPTTVRSGDSSTITCEVASPDNRPLTTTCNSSSGHLSGNNTTYTLDTAGAPAGPVTVNCTTTDDRGLSASTSTTVTVQAPPPPPQASKIGEIAFPNTKKPWRVDNTAKAILDDVALRLQREPDAKAVVVGYFEPKEKGGVKLAEERAVNTKEYLTKEKGIDPARIEVRTGTAGGNRAEIYLVPAGATFNQPDTTTFDESSVKPQTFHKAPAHPHHHHAKKAAPPAANQ